jgi:outer membrane protein TolC
MEQRRRLPTLPRRTCRACASWNRSSGSWRQDAEQVLLKKTVEDYSRSLQLTQHLYRGGAAAVADVDQAQAQLETARTQAADIALERTQTEYRYKAGLVTYLEVATTETTALQAQLSRVSILNRRMDASVLLVKALGGGRRAEAYASRTN